MLWHFSGSSSEISDRHRARTTLGLSFLVFGLFMLVLTGCDSEAMLSSDASERDTALRVLGTDARMMGYVDVHDQMAFSQDVMADNADMAEAFDEAMTRIREMSGVQLDQDVHGVYVAVSNFEENADGAVVAFVDFDQDAVAAAVASEEEFVRIDSDWPVDAFTVRNHEKDVSFAFAEGSFVMLANSETKLRSMLDRAYDQSAPVSMDPMMAAVADRSSWMVVRNLDQYVSDMGDENFTGDAAMLRPLMTSLQDIAVGMDQDAESVESELLIRPVSSVEVEDYANLMSGIRAMLRLQMRDMEFARDMVDRIDIEATDEWVTLEMSVEREELEELEARIREEMTGRWN